MPFILYHCVPLVIVSYPLVFLNIRPLAPMAKKWISPHQFATLKLFLLCGTMDIWATSPSSFSYSVDSGGAKPRKPSFFGISLVLLGVSVFLLFRFRVITSIIAKRYPLKNTLTEALLVSLFLLLKALFRMGRFQSDTFPHRFPFFLPPYRKRNNALVPELPLFRA